MGRQAAWILCAAALIGDAVAATAVAQAGPPGPPPPPPPCSFALTVAPPTVEGVAATVQSTGCAALAVPYSAVACLQTGDIATTCAQAHDDQPARVVLPYRPGAVYIATGRGCAGWVALPPAPDCQELGPYRATP